VYVNDIVVKIKLHASLLDNLAQVFDRLRSTHTKLNPDKFVFGVTAVKLLGFLVSYRGIETNPEKIRMIEAMRPPARIKDVQKLTCCFTTLSRFISRLAEWTLPIFKLLRHFGPFVWTDKAEEAFQELKRYLTSPPVMVALEPGEPLMLYITATAEAMSMVLVAECSEPPQPQETKEATVQDPRVRNHQEALKLGSSARWSIASIAHGHLFAPAPNPPSSAPTYRG
jgi:hypothetical protein